MHITFRQLRLFRALADTGSVGAAARALHVSQPTASMQLREISQALGLPLYEVISRKVRLTEAGQELARTARAIAGEWDDLAQRIEGLRGGTRGRLRVAVVSTAKYFVPRWLGSFCASHPGIEISLEVLNRDGVVARLREWRDDLYIMSRPPQDLDLEDHVLMPNPLRLVAPAGHPLAGQGPLALDALAGQPFILREPGSGTRLAVDAHFRQHGYVPLLRLELGSNEAIREAVAGGLGLSVLSHHALGRALDDGSLAELPVTGFPIESVWHLVHPRGRRLPPSAAVFRDHVLQQAGQRSGPADASVSPPPG
ncbi:MAG: LysR family transcriptional regulator [Rhodoferax sp.]|nr:LysR family transcriptional regulator [Rhodoferax sp.]